MARKKKISVGRGGENISPSLCDALILEILIRVPTKTLMRSKCVSRNWRGMISDPVFLKTFIKRSKSLPPLISGFFYSYSTKRVKFCEIDCNNSDVDIALKFLQCYVLPISSHNGLLLCGKSPKQDFHYILCNPCTKKWVTLPKPHHHHFLIKCVILYSYTNEELNVEFKVVSLTEYRDDGVIELDTYSSETGEWKDSKIFHNFDKFNPSNHQSVLFDGSAYFYDSKSRHVCVSNLKDESDICFIDLPEHQFNTKGNGLLAVSAGCLYYTENTGTHFQLWVLVNVVEWSLKCKIEFKSLRNEFQETPKFDCWFYPLAFHPLDHDLILVRLICNGEDVLLHIDRRTIEVIDDTFGLFSVIPYSLPSWPPCIRNAQAPYAHGQYIPLQTTLPGYYAIILWDLNLLKKIPDRIWVEIDDSYVKFYQKVEVGQLPKFCSHCKTIGHFLSECRYLKVDLPKENAGDN